MADKTSQPTSDNEPQVPRLNLLTITIPNTKTKWVKQCLFSFTEEDNPPSRQPLNISPGWTS